MLSRIIQKKLDGREKFINTGVGKFSVIDYWQYAFSNLNSNILRGSLAEFLVEKALNVDQIEIRNSWADFDVSYRNKKIEVKCSSYLQDWDQDKLSRIVFSGLKARDLYWSSAVSKFDKNKIKSYKADIYIFCLVKHMDRDTFNILDLKQWCFFVVDREGLNKITKNGSSITLLTLRKNSIDAVAFEELKIQVDKLIDLFK